MTRRHADRLPPAPFARHKGRHVRGADTTGWGRLARYCEQASRHPVVAEGFTRRRTAPVGLAPYPMAADLYLTDVPDSQLDAVIAERVAAMDDDEVNACWNAYRRGGDRSPLIVAGMRESRRRKQTRAVAS